MNNFTINMLLAIAWGAITGDFQPNNLFFGFALGFIVLWIINKGTGNTHYFKRLPKIIEFIVFFLWEMFVANLRLIFTVLSPTMPIRPAVIAVPLDLRNENSIILLANLITLTPGTLSLDISDNRDTLYVHTFNLSNEKKFRDEIKQGFERRVKEIFEP